MPQGKPSKDGSDATPQDPKPTSTTGDGAPDPNEGPPR
jgi:hypothetical protein